MASNRWIAGATAAFLFVASGQVFGQSAMAPGWYALSTFDSTRMPKYGLTSQVTSPDTDSDDAPPQAAAVATPNSALGLAPRPATDVFNNPTCSSCGSCGTCNGGAGAVRGCCAPQWSPIVLAESTFFWPQLSHASTFAGTGSSGLAGPLDQQLSGANSLFVAGPRIAFGIQGPVWGLVGRLWYASNWGSNFSPTDTTAGIGGVSAYNAFQAYTTDLEMQRRWAGPVWNFWGFGGIRYGSVNINHRDTVNENDNGYALSATAYSAQRFNGTGLTFGGYGTRALGNSPFKLFFSNRYSVLWGNSRADAQTATSMICTTMPSTLDASGMIATRTSDLFIAEFQTGTQWERQLVWFPGRAFVRGAFEYQYWNAGGSLNASASSLSHFFPDNSRASADAGSILFNMVGISVGAGIIYSRDRHAADDAATGGTRLLRIGHGPGRRGRF